MEIREEKVNDVEVLKLEERPGIFPKVKGLEDIIGVRRVACQVESESTTPSGAVT